MTDIFSANDGATPLTPEEREALIPSYVSNRAELNNAEQANIIAAIERLSRRRRPVLDEAFLRGLHRQMFRQVWRWAGQYRITERNIGVESWRIAPEILTLLDDARYWIAQKVFAPDEIAIRFSHRLVWIHPFANGTGRHSRLAGDLLVVELGEPPFTWGRLNAADVLAGEARRRYIKALQTADRHDYGDLIAYART